MRRLYHPTMPDTSVEVADADVDSWTEQGWRKTDPSKSRSRTSTADSGDEATTSQEG